MVKVFESPSHAAVELVERHLPELQALFEANPEYFLLVSGAPPRPNEAVEEFNEEPPAHIPHGRRWFLGFFDGAKRLDGMGIVVRDLGAQTVWHIALYLWATSLHGTGTAKLAHAALENWARSLGARWLRLGVVVGNSRAERFWERLGYVEARRRGNIAAGVLNNEVRIMVKPLDGQDVQEYLALVPRDNPDSDLP